MSNQIRLHNPGGGSSQSSNVRTGTLRLIAAEGT